MRTTLCLALTILFSPGRSQDLSFHPGNWQTSLVGQQRIGTTLVSNEERFDTMYTENINSGDMVMVTEHVPLSRYEYFPLSHPLKHPTQIRLHRRIEIRQEQRQDTTYVEDINTGELRLVVQTYVVDVPWGAFEEFVQNESGGYMLWRGHVEGWAPDGSMRRVGQWQRLDPNGVVLEEIEF